jgi:hypothetical protein
MEVNMATLIQTYATGLDRLVVARKQESFIDRLIPRRCMVVSTGLILIGMSIPFLILCNVLPSMLILYFAGFIITLMGGIFTLIFCGEI